ncbi:AMP-binding protein [Vibrio makurazakiensis]|uniref:AMP-binding protein n=1 Tax=Vibrio makurazakiensis TaxID=2910250 RepID=UPI003D13DC13
MNTLPFQCVSLSNVMINDRAPQSLVAFNTTTQHSWSDFTEKVKALSSRLKDSSEASVAICAQDSYLFAIAFFACTQTRKQIVLPGNYQPSALVELSEHFGLLLHDVAVKPISGRASIALETLISSDSNTGKTVDFTLNDIALDDLSVTLFTSGSSGTPKAIHKSLHQLNVEIEQLEQQWGPSLRGACVHSTVSQQHIYGLLFRLLWPLCAGRAFSCHNLEYPEQVMNIADESNVLISSPALLKRMSDDFDTRPMRMVFSSGGPLHYDSAQQAQALFDTLPFEVFGSTETGGIAFRQQHSEHEPWALFNCIEAQLNAENCLRLKSPYLNDNHWYQTADECEFIDDKRFHLKGRTDRVIKIEEKRISLVEVEKRLEDLQWIAECVAIPYTQEQRLTLAAILVLSSEGKAKLNELGKGKFWLLLRTELREWLEPIAIPRRYRLCNEIPLNSQGKRLMSEIEQILSV